MSSEAKDLAIASIVIYLLIAPASLYAMFMHVKQDRANLGGWIYFQLFIGLQVVGNGIVANNETNIVGIILTTIGLSPLVMGTNGIIHEITRHTELAKNPIFSWISGMLFHVGAIVGAVLLAYGSTKLYDTNESASDISQGEKLAKVGVILFVILIIWLGVACVMMIRVFHELNSLRKLYMALICTIPFFGLRIVFSLLSVFDTSTTEFSPIGGKISVRVVMEVVPMMLILILLVFGGIVTRHADQTPVRRGDMHLEPYNNKYAAPPSRGQSPMPAARLSPEQYV